MPLQKFFTPLLEFLKEWERPIVFLTIVSVSIGLLVFLWYHWGWVAVLAAIVTTVVITAGMVISGLCSDDRNEFTS